MHTSMLHVCILAMFACARKGGVDDEARDMRAGSTGSIGGACEFPAEMWVVSLNLGCRRILAAVCRLLG
jgi:hypothetical protein